MSIALHILNFLRNGYRVFIEASCGSYRINSEVILKMRDEIMNDMSTDSRKLFDDRQNVARDFRNAVNNLSLYEQ